MDSAIKNGYRLGIEHFYGYVFSKRANQAMKTDTELLNNLRSLDFWGAIGKLHHKGLIATEVVLVIATAACAVGLAGRDQKSTELPSTGQPTIGLITEASAGSDLLLNQQLSGVKTLSGRADCLPQLVAVDGGNLGAETVGLCQVNTKDGQGTEVIVRKQKGGDQQTIKQMLTARTSPETLYFEYGSGDQKETLFKYDVASGGTEWVLPDGKTIEFKKGQSPFEEMIGKILDPGNVAQAAEATQVYDPTKSATVTATLDGKLTITQPTPTETPTPTTTAEIIPAEVRQYSVDGVDLRPQKINGEWVWSNSENKTILTWDAKSQKVMVYSQTKEGTMIFRMDAELGYIQDLSGWSDDSAREAIKNWGAATKVDVSGLKGFDLRVIAEDFDKTGKVLGMDYTEISLKNGEFIYVEKPTIEGNYLIIYYHPSKYMRGSEYFDWLETYKSKGGSYSFVSNVLGQAQIGYSINSVYVTSTPILQGNIDGLDLRPVDIGN